MSADSPISARTVRFLERRIDSVAELELLLHLASTSAAEPPDAVARALALNEYHVGQIAASLVRRGLVKLSGGDLAYAPRRRGDREAVDELMTIYSKYRVRVATIILASPGSQVRDFADAFRLRSEREDGDV